MNECLAYKRLVERTYVQGQHVQDFPYHNAFQSTHLDVYYPDIGGY